MLSSNREPRTTRDDGLRITIRRAKLNYKYKRRRKTQKQRPRLNDDDTSVLTHMLQRTRVRFGYDPTTNDLWFDTPIPGNDIDFDGLDTGGQTIRFWLQYSVLHSGGRSDGPPAPLTVTSDGKACMLYVQACMFTLAVGESFVVRGGNPDNADAPTPRFFGRLFEELEGLLGLSFRLEDRSLDAGGESCFELVRSEDVTPDFDWRPGTVPLDVHMVDQLLMAIGFVRPNCSVILRCELKKDYHVDAMVRILQVLGHTIGCEVGNDEKVITIGQIGEDTSIVENHKLPVPTKLIDSHTEPSK